MFIISTVVVVCLLPFLTEVMLYELVVVSLYVEWGWSLRTADVSSLQFLKEQRYVDCSTEQNCSSIRRQVSYKFSMKKKQTFVQHCSQCTENQQYIKATPWSVPILHSLFWRSAASPSVALSWDGVRWGNRGMFNGNLSRQAGRWTGLIQTMMTVANSQRKRFSLILRDKPTSPRLNLSQYDSTTALPLLTFSEYLFYKTHDGTKWCLIKNNWVKL